MVSVTFNRISSTPPIFNIRRQYSPNLLPEKFAVFDPNGNGLFVVHLVKGNKISRTREETEVRIRKQNLFHNPSPLSSYADPVSDQKGDQSVEIWKYNLSANNWMKLKFPKVRIKNLVLIENYDVGKLLIVFRSIRDTFVVSLYDFRTEKLIKVYSTKSLHPFFDSCVCKDGNCLYVVNYGQGSSTVLNSFDLNSLTFHDITVLPKVQCTPKLVPRNGKIFVFYNPYYSWDLDARKVYCYNLSSCAWSTLSTGPDDCLPSDFVRYSVANLNDSCYHFGGYGSFGDTDDGRHRTEIWKFHFPTLSWTKLPIELPFSKLIFFSHFTNHGRMILCFENGLYQLNVTSKPRPLENICWELISYHPRIRPLISHTNGELKQFGISNIFIKKLRW